MERAIMERAIRSGPQRPRLLGQVFDAMRRKHYSLRTELHTLDQAVDLLQR